MAKVRLLLANAKNPAEKLTGCTGTNILTAVRAGDEPLVLGLLAANQGLIINKPNDKGWTALHFAAKGCFPAICKLLIQAGADVKYCVANSRY